MLLPMIASLAVAQTQAAPPPESKQFDFWVGSWNCETIESANIRKGQKASNVIRRTHDGHVVEENFTMGGFKGSSWSIYVPALKKWRQTWVDNQGGYFTLEGEYKDGQLTLQTLPRPAQPNNAQRMVFMNIKKDSFDWKWQGTQDGGKTWKLLWHLKYTRKA